MSKLSQLAFTGALPTGSLLPKGDFWTRYSPSHIEALDSLYSEYVRSIGVHPTVVTPPAPRLVGVEPNPGPPKTRVKVVETLRVKTKKKRSKNKTKSKALVRALTTIPPTHGSYVNSQTNRGVQRIGSRPTAQHYKETLCDPFNCPPVRLGWGTFIPTSLNTAFLKGQVPIAAAATCFCLIANDSIATPSGGSSPGFLRSYEGAVSTELLSSTGVFTPYLPTNQSVLSNLMQSARVVSQGLRVTVRYPATSTRGRLYAGFFPEETGSNFNAQSYNTLLSMFNMKECYGTVGGEMTCEVQYRPTDTTSFDLLNERASVVPAAGTALKSNLVVVGAGWAAGTFQVSFSEILHLESTSGLDFAGEDAGAPTLAGEGVTMEAAGVAVAGLDPVRPNLTAIEMVDHALQHAQSSLSRTGFGRNSLGRLSIDSSSISAPDLSRFNSEYTVVRRG